MCLHKKGAHSHGADSRRSFLSGLIPGALFASFALGQPQSAESMRDRFRRMSADFEKKGLAEPFKGITADGNVQPGLFPIQSSGVSTQPMRESVQRLLQSLTAEQRSKAMFPIDDPEWRKWMNQHFYVRQGVSLLEMTGPQRDAAFSLLRVSMSPRGFELARNIMRLNETLAELSGDHEFLGEQLYYFTFMGKPSATEPWGWQLDGHHCIINYFVLGDQAVMTPHFFGSEPVIAESGKYKGITILQEEQNQGLAMVNRLNDSQRKAAILSFSKTGNNNLTEAFKDNVVLEYTGLKASALQAADQRRLIDLIELYVANMDSGHAKVKMKDVQRRLDETRFAWLGGTDAKSVFYYRIHSPVILIEFDHQSPANLRKPGIPAVPTQQHIHCVVRTPNGNDYGKDLLRQHYQKQAHAV